MDGKNEMDDALKVAQALIKAMMAEARFYWRSNGEEFHHYRRMQAAVAAALLEQETDEAFKDFLVNFNPLFRISPQGERIKATLEALKDPDIRKAVLELEGHDH